MEEWITQWTPSEVLAALGLLVGAISGIVVPIILLRSNRKAAREARQEERAAAKEARNEEREEARRRATEAELQRWRDEAAPLIQELRSILRSIAPGLLPPERPTDDRFEQLGQAWWGIRARLDQLTVAPSDPAIREKAAEVRSEMGRYWTFYNIERHEASGESSPIAPTPEMRSESLKALHQRTLRTIDGFVAVLHSQDPPL